MKMNNTWGSVYIIRCGKFYKVGRTNGSVEARMKQLQAGNPIRLELICTLPDPTPSRIERIIHTAYKAQRVSGEWFNFTAMDIESLQYESRAAHARKRGI
jgi:Meiotically Up-regulated Gene 113 (MUG113) protein